MGELSDRVKQTQPATPRERCERWARNAVQAEHASNRSAVAAMMGVLDDAQRENVTAAMRGYDPERVTKWIPGSMAWEFALDENHRKLSRVIQYIMGVVR